MLNKILPMTVVVLQMVYLSQLDDSPYGDVRATQLTAVAAKDNVSSVVEVIPKGRAPSGRL